MAHFMYAFLRGVILQLHICRKRKNLQYWVKLFTWACLLQLLRKFMYTQVLTRYKICLHNLRLLVKFYPSLSLPEVLTTSFGTLSLCKVSHQSICLRFHKLHFQREPDRIPWDIFTASVEIFFVFNGETNTSLKKSQWGFSN